MQKVRVPITNFQFGEVSPSLYSRTDTAVYTASAQRVENFFLRSEGGVIKRSGTEYIYEFSDITPDSTKTMQSRLIPFLFSDDEQYIVSLEHQKVRVFIIDPVTGAVSLTSTITQDVDANTLVFDDDYLHEYTWAQAQDVMFICHPTFRPQQLVRTSLTTFAIEPYYFDSRADGSVTFQPFHKFHGVGTTISASATSGTGVTFTTNNPYFLSGHVGVTFRHHNDAEFTITSVTNSTTAVGNITDVLEKRLIPNAFRTRDGSAVVQVTHINHGFAGGESIVIKEASKVGGITAANLNGSRTILKIIDEDTYEFTAGASASDAEDGGGAPVIETGAATTEFYEQSFSDLRGWPGAVTFHENRLCFAGTIAQPDGIFMSKSANYYNFDINGADDDDSIQLTASIGTINQIRHLVSNRDLQIFGATDELYIPAFASQPLTPTNAIIRRQTPFGSGFVSPVSLDGSTTFLQNNGLIAREYIYDDAEGAYVANSISGISSHLIKTPFQQAALRGGLERNESYIFMVNTDGTMAVFNSNRAEQRAGWTEFTCAGKFKSVAVVDDRVFVNILVDLGDGTEEIILCELKSDLNMDLSRTYSGTAGVFDVSSYWNDGAVLDVVAGTYYYGSFTVSGGNIDVSAVDASLTSAEIGKAFTVTLTTNPIDANVGFGPTTGLPRGIGSVFVDLNNTLAAKVNGSRLIIRNVVDDMSAERTPVTGKREFRSLGYSRDPQVTITQDEPLPLQVNGLVVELTF